MNQATPIKKTRRRPNRSPSEPPIRMRHGQGQQVARHHPLQPATLGSQVPADGRQGHIHHGAVQRAIPEPSTVATKTHRPGPVR